MDINTDKNKIKKKIIKLHIDDKKFSHLFDVKNDKLGSLCFKLFNHGYKTYFPEVIINQNQSNVIKEINTNGDSIKTELNKINDKVGNLDISDKLGEFSTLIKDLLGISNNVSKKGRVGEDFIYGILETKFPDYAIQKTRNIPHSGDAIITIPPTDDITKQTKIMLEIKNYIKPVDPEEIIKLKTDMKTTGINYGIIMSLKSAFVGKKRLSVELFTENGDYFYILYVPNVQAEILKIESAFIVIERIIAMNLHDKYNIEQVSSCLIQLDDLYNNYIQLKTNYVKMEMLIRKELDNHYNFIRNYEIDLKKNMNNILKLENNSSANTNNGNKILNLIFDIFNKYDIKITRIDKLWNITHDEINIGIISEHNKIIEVNFTNCKLIFDKKNSSYKSNLDLLDYICRGLYKT